MPAIFQMRFFMVSCREDARGRRRPRSEFYSGVGAPIQRQVARTQSREASLRLSALATLRFKSWLDTLALQCKVTAVQPNWAEENLQVIRTLMERAGLYRRALAPVMLAVGLIGLGAGLLGAWVNVSWIWGFGQYWTTIALLGVVVTAVLVRRQALNAQEPFWTMPARKVCVALAPPFVLGGVLGLFDVHRGFLDSRLVEIWLSLYGCGLCAAGMFLTRGVRLLGWAFILTGITVGAAQNKWGLLGVSLPGDPNANWFFANSKFIGWHLQLEPNLVMAATFGAFHLVAGIYLYFTERKEPKP